MPQQLYLSSRRVACCFFCFFSFFSSNPPPESTLRRKPPWYWASGRCGGDASICQSPSAILFVEIGIGPCVRLSVYQVFIPCAILCRYPIQPIQGMASVLPCPVFLFFSFFFLFFFSPSAGLANDCRRFTGGSRILETNIAFPFVQLCNLTAVLLTTIGRSNCGTQQLFVVHMGGQPPQRHQQRFRRSPT